MIKIDGVEIAMEGRFMDLIREAARIMHSVAKAAEKNFQKEDPDREDVYDEAMQMILEEAHKMTKFDVADATELPQDMKQEFNRLLQKQRQKNKNNPEFIDYDTTIGDVQDASGVMKSIIKGVYNDPRTPMDTEDIDTIRKANAKSKAANEAKKKKK